MERNSVQASVPAMHTHTVMAAPEASVEAVLKGGEPPSVPSGPVSVVPAVLVVLASVRVPGVGAAAGVDRGAGRGAVTSVRRSWPC